MWEPIRFLLFSTVETMAAFTLMLSIFRLKALEYVWPALFISIVMNLQSYILREEMSLSYLAPAISTLLYVLLITTVVRVPILWAAIISITGTFLYTLVQAIMIGLFFRAVATADLQNSAQGSLVQAITSAWVFVISFVLLKLKIGFTADFERLRIKWEQVLVIVFIVGSLMASTFMFYYNDLFLMILYLSMAAGLFLYYALKKEKEELEDD
ncbi:hypothetical protein P4H61_08530 [Paenibacillus peoriae]|uniref:hypothetical protein n=1 Tax=Paenibacillus peoriae TaxID=59893 RepID=UPI00026C5BA5|nr:hypothetical protein [Paenibacillus peoriae]MEC0181543.1 hypothetical protein [Paenibacillus peoriae]